MQETEIVYKKVLRHNISFEAFPFTIVAVIV